MKCNGSFGVEVGLRIRREILERGNLVEAAVMNKSFTFQLSTVSNVLLEWLWIEKPAVSLGIFWPLYLLNMVSSELANIASLMIHLLRQVRKWRTILLPQMLKPVHMVVYQVPLQYLKILSCYLFCKLVLRLKIGMLLESNSNIYFSQITLTTSNISKETAVPATPTMIT